MMLEYLSGINTYICHHEALHHHYISSTSWKIKLLNSKRVLIFQITLQGYSSIFECDWGHYLSSTEHIDT